MIAIPMGDTNAVDVAQQVHARRLASAGCIGDDVRVDCGECLPTGKYLEGVYVDDHVLNDGQR